MRAVGGGIWLGDGADLGMVGGAPTSGLGIRVTKGISSLWAFEADISGGVTGRVRFDDVMWDASPGDISRNAKFARFFIGGQLRFGDQFQPHARFGIGAQLVQHDSLFMPETGGEREGPDAGVALDLLWTAGVGMTMRVKEHWIIGVEVSGLGVAQALSSDTLRGGFEAGLWAGYGWNL